MGCGGSEEGWGLAQPQEEAIEVVVDQLQREQQPVQLHIRPVPRSSGSGGGIRRILSSQPPRTFREACYCWPRRLILRLFVVLLPFVQTVQTTQSVAHGLVAEQNLLDGFVVERFSAQLHRAAAQQGVTDHGRCHHATAAIAVVVVVQQGGDEEVVLENLCEGHSHRGNHVGTGGFVPGELHQSP